MADWIWILIPIVAITAPFAYKVFSKWIDFKKSQEGPDAAADWKLRFEESEDALAAAQRRIENLETIVVNRLLEVPGSPELQVKSSENAASRIARQVRA